MKMQLRLAQIQECSVCGRNIAEMPENEEIKKFHYDSGAIITLYEFCPICSSRAQDTLDLEWQRRVREWTDHKQDEEDKITFTDFELKELMWIHNGTMSTTPPSGHIAAFDRWLEAHLDLLKLLLKEKKE